MFSTKMWRNYEKVVVIQSCEHRSEQKSIERKLVARKKSFWYNKSPTTLKAPGIKINIFVVGYVNSFNLRMKFKLSINN